jgi:hypothetical protein
MSRIVIPSLILLWRHSFVTLAVLLVIVVLGTFHVFGVPGRTHAVPVISVAVAVAAAVAVAVVEVVVEVAEVVVEEVADPAVSAGAS